MSGSVQLGDLTRIVAHFGSTKLAPYLEQRDVESAARVVHCIASTLEETKVRIDPNHHMLRTTEAKALAGYLRGKYKGRAKRKQAERRRDSARASIDARDALIQTGDKVTEARVSAEAELDEQYLLCVEAEISSQEVVDLFDELRAALADRHEVMVEISRNDRAIYKGKEDS
jgi:hypothetical protein